MSGQQGGVGGQIYGQPGLCAGGQHGLKPGVQERFAQNMQAELAGQGGDLLQDRPEFIQGHIRFGPRGAGAKTAAQVAAVGDFHVDVSELCVFRTFHRIWSLGSGTSGRLK